MKIFEEDKISKHKQYGFVYGKRIKTPIGRFAWPFLVTAKESTFPVKEGEVKPGPRFEVTFLIDANSKESAEFKEALEEMGGEMLKLYNQGKTKGKLGELGEVLKEEDGMDLDKYPYYAEKLFMVPKHKDQPKVFDASVESVSAEVVKGGMKGLIVIRPILTAHGLSYQLLSVQLAKDDGVRFAGGIPDSKDMLEVLEDGEGEATEDLEEDSEEVAAAPVIAQKKSSKSTLNLDRLK